jgi:hypothetical protein
MPSTLTHAAARNAVLVVIDVIATSPGISELELVAVLEREGFSLLHAEKLCVFVPSVFAWALLKRMGLQSFPSYYVALDKLGKEAKLPIATEHYFTAALELAWEALEHGWTPVLTRERFESLVNRSAELGAANRLLNSGKALADAKLLPLRLFRISAELAREE